MPLTRLLASMLLTVEILAIACSAPAPSAPTQAAAVTSANATVAAAARPAGTAIAQAAPTVIAAVAGAATAIAKPGSAAPVTVTFWHGMNGSEPGTQGGALQTLVDQYKQVAPNVTINLDFTPYTGNELQQKVTGAIVAHNTPDLVQAFESDVAAWYQAGSIAPPTITSRARSRRPTLTISKRRWSTRANSPSTKTVNFPSRSTAASTSSISTSLSSRKLAFPMAPGPGTISPRPAPRSWRICRAMRSNPRPIHSSRWCGVAVAT
jgi:hypothetical protein